jgi:phosphoenolpyruvate synthase/pyruvate phosphate dikinase
MEWTDAYRKLGVRTNSDTPGQVKQAILFGGEGIGLTRSEHMFFEGNRIDAVREMILADDDDGRAKALVKIKAFQKKDFIGIFKALDGRPATIRLLDPPLHEFIGTMDASQIKDLSAKIGMSAPDIKKRIHSLHEENPMLGFRGASRYYSPRYRDGFGLECQAIRRVREQLGFRNVIVMVPFCRTLDEADRVLAEMARHGLVRGACGLEVYVMAEIPSNIILAREFGARFDGFSIGSNDLTQLTLGVDRDNALLADLFDERDPAVVRSIEHLIAEAHAVGCKVGICGQAPSDHPDFADLLVRAGIDSISLNPDSVVPVLTRVAALETAMAAAEAAVTLRVGAR